MSTHYAPGQVAVAVTRQGLVALGADVPHDVAARVWSRMGEGRGLPGVLEALTGAFGTSLAAIPPFAVVLEEGDAVRVAVRGEFIVEIEGEEPLSGAGVTTWTERAYAGAGRVALTTSEAAGSPAALPVVDAVVLASAVTWIRDAAAAAAPATPAAEPVPPVPAVPAVPVPEAVPAVPAVPATPAVPPAVPAAPAPASTAPISAVPGLIDSRAVTSIADTLMPVESTEGPGGLPSEETAIPDDEPDFGDTVVSVRRSARDAAQTPVDEATLLRPDAAVSAPPAPGAASAPVVTGGDHDGATVSLAEVRAARAARDDSAPAPLAPPRAAAPGRIRLSTGQLLRLDRTVVIGRRPRATRVAGTDLPHLVAVESPQQDISRSHLELRVEGDSIVATDLRTTNGTTLRRPGTDPVRLHPGEGTVVVPGDVLDLGDGIVVTVEEIA
ncbi:FHA domain-containing protein [Microbacterium hominis]|uniref:FHA domain-containing protein n=1 Tax=Microbacterium hominis TaxID=162426 RepID=A0A7D4PSZ2_9MICO|nr:FHA domain-containing protein [Microbacterium hominis]QKJ18194.1 FHA domain-containing protein [Microbacterium hominis]